MERKKSEQIQGRISRRRLVCNPTIQHVIINLYTKYDSSSLQGCGEIFDEKVLRNYGRTDGLKDGRKDGQNDDRCKPVYPPLFQSGGITIKFYSMLSLLPVLNAKPGWIQRFSFKYSRIYTLICLP